MDPLHTALSWSSPWIYREDSTEDGHLKQQVDEMAQRIKQLEDALALVQSTVSLDTHPLLAQHLNRVRSPPEATAESHSVSDELADALGTLRIGDQGNLMYYGRSGGSEVRSITSQVLLAHLNLYFVKTEPIHGWDGT